MYIWQSLLWQRVAHDIVLANDNNNNSNHSIGMVWWYDDMWATTKVNEPTNMVRSHEWIF